MNQTSTGIYFGFEGYRTPSVEELRTALRNSLVALDANVLLNLYRYNESTREDLFNVLEKIGDRLWVPHQAMREFWRNRLSALSSRGSAVTQLTENLEKQRRAARQGLESWAKQIALEAEESTDIRMRVDTFYDDLIAEVKQKRSGRGGSLRTDEDAILLRIESLLDGRVGHPLGEDEYAMALQEAERRLDQAIPPGFRDAKKTDESDNPEGGAGDYLVWLQATNEGAARKMDLVLITGDEKDDWWWKHRADFLGPRIELSEEYRSRSGRTLFAMRPRDLLEYADALNVHVRDESVDEVERVENLEVPQSLWTHAGVTELLRLLDYEDADQAHAIRDAAIHDGFVTRETVYELGNYSDDRMLRGYTRPVNRITRQLQDKGVVADDVTPMLRPVYRGVKASGFVIPLEVVDILGNKPQDPRLDGIGDLSQDEE